MLPEINTTSKGLSFCQTSVQSFLFERSKTWGNSSCKGFSPWRVQCLVLLCWPFFPETVLFIPVFARVLILVVFTEFLPNFSKNSIKQCSLSATAREYTCSLLVPSISKVSLSFHRGLKESNITRNSTSLSESHNPLTYTSFST